MNYQWVGAALIVAGCGGTGFSIAADIRKEEAMLQQMISAVQYMKAELQYRLTPLPQLCIQAKQYTTGSLKKLFDALAIALEQQTLPQASDCMYAAIRAVPELPKGVRIVCQDLGRSLGQLDLAGQIQGLDQVCALCERNRKKLEQSTEQRQHSYQTLWLCGGAALAILLL